MPNNLTLNYNIKELSKKKMMALVAECAMSFGTTSVVNEKQTNEAQSWTWSAIAQTQSERP